MGVTTKTLRDQNRVELLSYLQGHGIRGFSGKSKAEILERALKHQTDTQKNSKGSKKSKLKSQSKRASSKKKASPTLAKRVSSPKKKVSTIVTKDLSSDEEYQQFLVQLPPAMREHIESALASLHDLIGNQPGVNWTEARAKIANNLRQKQIDSFEDLGERPPRPLTEAEFEKANGRKGPTNYQLAWQAWEWTRRNWNHWNLRNDYLQKLLDIKPL